MANAKKGPRMIREIRRLKDMGLGTKKIAGALGISKNTVKSYLVAEGAASGTDAAIYSASWATLVDWDRVRASLLRGNSLKWYHEENIATSDLPDLKLLTYMSFWREWKRRYPTYDLDFHKDHPPGEKMEIDYKGDAEGLGYTDMKTKSFIQCKLYGSILCHSQKVYFEATETEKQQDWFHGTEGALRYFGGAPRQIIFDHAKVMITRSDWYDPDINREFARFAEYFGLAPIPARPGKPKDKNLIEGALGIFWRWLRPKVRSRTFFSLSELNAFVRDHVEIFNNRVQRKYGMSRSSRFDLAERSCLKALPEAAFESAEWKKAKVHPDCHIQVEWNFYSVPYKLRGQEVEVRMTRSFIEIFSGLDRIALHQKLHRSQRGRYAFDKAHLPAVHLAMQEFVPAKVIEDAGIIGTETHRLISKLIKESSHPYLYLRRCLGIVRLKNKYTAQKVESASKVINDIGNWLPRLRDFENIVKSPLSQAKEPSAAVKRGSNPNLRGMDYWQEKPFH